jgi:hypothetical protein
MKQLFQPSISFSFLRLFRVANHAGRTFLPILFSLWIVRGSAQAVSGIITDYNGFWKSSVSSLNSTKPNNNHNLLAFTYNNVQYSTGANDPVLTNHGESFVAGDFWSLPVGSLSGTVNSNTKVGVGEMYDAVHNGPSNPPPANDIASYLTDGIKGLNIGTCIANLPAGTMTFYVSNITPQNIGDGVPDILVTQVADPSNSSDTYSFTDASGSIIGHSKSIVFTNITPVGTWTADFYEASTNPMVLQGNFTNTDRPIRLWAADLSDFGISAANYQNIRLFKINLSGNSDVAFAAYNNKTFNVNTPLAVTLSDFSAMNVNTGVQLQWATETEINSWQFILEKSLDNRFFMPVGSIPAAGNSTERKQYSFTDDQPFTGTCYYRLKITGQSRPETYSKVIQVQTGNPAGILRLSPNPCHETLRVMHVASEHSRIIIYNANGHKILQKILAPGSEQTSLTVAKLLPGLYFIVWQTDTQKITRRLLIH